MIKRIVKLELQADKVEDFQAIFAESKMKILAQEGCFHVELLRSVSPDNVFFHFFSLGDRGRFECLSSF